MKSKYYDVISFDTKRGQNTEMYLCAISGIMSIISFAWLMCRNRSNFVNREGHDSVMTIYDAFDKAVVEE